MLNEIVGAWRALNNGVTGVHWIATLRTKVMPFVLPNLSSFLLNCYPIQILMLVLFSLAKSSQVETLVVSFMRWKAQTNSERLKRFVENFEASEVC